jgi:hypothetical protein
MSKPSDETGRAPDRERELSKMTQIAAAAEGLFEHPNMVPGHPPRHLSPRGMVEATREPRHDQTQDELLWLTETPLVAIDKDGIDLLRKVFTGLDLLPLTTGPKTRLRRDLVLRYNRAELARGVLKEIVVLERDAQGVYTELGRATRSEVFRQDTDYSVVLRERAAYIEDLVSKVKLDAESYVRIERGTQSVEELVGAIHARERFQRRARHKPIVASPRWERNGLTVEGEADYVKMMDDRPAAAEPEPVPAELRLADVIGGAAAATPTKHAAESAGRAKKRPKENKSATSAQKKLRSGRPTTRGRSKDINAPPLVGGSVGLADLLSSSPLHPNDE